MTDYQIVCITLSDDESHISQVGLVERGGDIDSASRFATPQQINDLIGEEEHTCFFTDKNGNEVEVLEYGDRFIRTKADRISENNLRHLRNCNPFS